MASPSHGRIRTWLVIAAVTLGGLALGARLVAAASTKPIEGGYYDNCAHHADECVQIIATPSRHHVSIGLIGGAPGCQLMPHLPPTTRLRHDNSFAASGATPKWGNHPVQHVRIVGRFVSRKKARATLTDCDGRQRRITLPYRGLAGTGP
jgi:hypothetical protein